MTTQLTKEQKSGGKLAVRACNHCGECCLTITCQVAQVFFKIAENTQCPALEENTGLYYCGLIKNTDKYVNELVGNQEWKAKYLSQMFGQWLGIGYGCDSKKNFPSPQV